MWRQTHVRFSTAARSALVLVALVAVRADIVTVSNGTNTTLATAQPISLVSNLILNQMPPNYTFGTAQPVSPLFYGGDVLGSIAASTTQEFFGVNVGVGQNLAMQVSSTVPASQQTELLLYDANGNLVAVASGNGPDGHSSVIDFTVPNGDAGVWKTEVTSPSSSFFNYNLRFTSPLIYTTDVMGSFPNLTDSGFYSVSANAGDNLHFSNMSTPAGQSTELLLYDPNGNLVAIASGNGPDGYSSVIDFTVPNGDAGNWVVQAADPGASLYAYDLTIQGATGFGPVDPLPTSAVPEPSSLSIFGAALAGLVVFRRRLTR
jgi:PEP-CTERM motif